MSPLNRRQLLLGVSAVAVASLAGCASGSNASSTPTPSPSPTPTPSTTPTQSPGAESVNPNLTGSANGVLVAYFSHTGNTELVAGLAAEASGAELFRIVEVEPYPTVHSETTALAQDEMNADVRPAISTQVADMSQYHTVILAYPNWWSLQPMIINTFLEQYDFSGKTIAPLCTHYGSGLGRSVRNIADRVPNATVVDGLAIRGGLDRMGVDGEAARTSITNWVNELGLTA